MSLEQVMLRQELIFTEYFQLYYWEPCYRADHTLHHGTPWLHRGIQEEALPVSVRWLIKLSQEEHDHWYDFWKLIFYEDLVPSAFEQVFS